MGDRKHLHLTQPPSDSSTTERLIGLPSGAANNDEAAKLAKQRADIERRAAQVQKTSEERYAEVGGMFSTKPRHKKDKPKRGRKNRGGDGGKA